MQIYLEVKIVMGHGAGTKGEEQRFCNEFYAASQSVERVGTVENTIR